MRQVATDFERPVMLYSVGKDSSVLLHLALKEAGSGTELSVQDALFGYVTDSSVSSLQEGWTQLFTDGLKKHVEGG